MKRLLSREIAPGFSDARTLRRVPSCAAGGPEHACWRTAREHLVRTCAVRLVVRIAAEWDIGRRAADAMERVTSWRPCDRRITWATASAGGCLDVDQTRRTDCSAPTA